VCAQTEVKNHQRELGRINVQFSLINLYQRSTGCPAAVVRVYHPHLRALRATTMSPACASMAPLQYVMSPELSLRIRAFHQTNMSGNNNDLYNAFNTSATSQATADDSPAFRGPYGQNGVTTRQSSPTSHEALIANSFFGPAEQTDEDRIDKLSMSFPRTFDPQDPYSRPSTPAPDYHRATASPNKIDIILRKTLADWQTRHELKNSSRWK